MNRTLKRVRTLAAGIGLGLVGATVFASAAQACHVEIDWDVSCADDGGWTVAWHATNWTGDAEGIIDSVENNGTLTGDIVDGASLPTPGSGTLEGVQTLTSEDQQATLSITASWPTWNGGDTQTNDWSVPQPQGGCEPTEVPTTVEPSESPSPEVPEPSVAVGSWSDCAGMAVTAINESETLAEFTFVPSTGDEVSGTPEVGKEFTQYFSVESEEGLSVTVLVNGEEYETYQWDGGGNCEWGTVYDTCDGLKFELFVSADAPETTVTLTPSEGDAVEAVLTPGAEPQVFTFTASGDELTVVWKAEEADDDKHIYSGEIPWTKPGECEEEVPPTSEASTTPVAQLPTTGSSMTIMISAAAALVVAAAVLFFIARRRRAAADW